MQFTDHDYERQCVASVQVPGGPVRRCKRDSIPPDEPAYLYIIPICSWHQDKARNQFAARLEAEIEELKNHECDGKEALIQEDTERMEWRIARNLRWRNESSAYFIRCGSYVKIGASASPAGRVESIRKVGGVLTPTGLDLNTAELVATEPGGFPREAELHLKFAHLRHTGEWFTESPELTEYIDSLAKAA